MRLLIRNLFVISSLLAFAAGAGVSQQTAKKPVSGKSASTHAGGKHASAKHRRSRKGAWKRKGQQAIQPERAREIQEALIREKYLTGEPTGVWDARSQAAMVRYQADNGWQSKVTPDSRALIKLGLGPDYSGKQLNLQSKADAVPASTTPAAAAGQDK